MHCTKLDLQIKKEFIQNIVQSLKLYFKISLTSLKTSLSYFEQDANTLLLFHGNF